MIVEPSEEMTQDPTKPVTPAGFELVLAQQANDAISRGANPKATTDRLGTMIRHLRANPDLATHGATALARGADPGAVTSRVWEMAQKGGDPQLHRDIGDLRNQVESTRVSPRPKTQGPGIGASVLSGAAQGSTFGFADETLGGIGALNSLLPTKVGGEGAPISDFTKNYRRDRDKVRNFDVAAGKEHGFAHGLATIAGGILPIVATGGAGASTGTLGSQLLKAGAQGALYGGAGGAGNAKELRDVPGQALTGAAIGGVTAPAMLLAGKGISNAAGALRTSKGDAAQALIRQRLQNSGTSPEDVLAQIRGNVEASGDKPEMLGDYASEVAKLTKNVTKRPGSGRALIQDAISSRNAGTAERIAGDLGSSSSVGPALPSAEDLIRSRATTAADQFPEAYADHVAIDDPRVLDLLKRPTFRKAYQMAQTMAADEGRDLPFTVTHELHPGAQALVEAAQESDRPALLQKLVQSGAAKEIKTPVPDVKTMAYVDRALRRMIDQGFDGGSPIVDPGHAQALQNAFGEFRDVLEQQSPAYANAVKNYAGRSGSIDAAQLGRRLSDAVQPTATKATDLALGDGDPMAMKAITTGLPAVEKAVGGMSPFDAAIFRQEARGAARSALERVPATEEGSTTSALRSIFPNSIAGKRAQSMMFDTPSAAQSFQGALARERNMARVGSLMRGSDTIENAAENADVAPKTLLSLIRRPAAAFGKGLDYLEARKTASLYDQLAPMLAAQGSEGLQGLLSQLGSRPAGNPAVGQFGSLLRNLLAQQAASQ